MSPDTALPLLKTNVVQLWPYPEPPPPEAAPPQPHRADYTYTTAPDDLRTQIFASKSEAYEFLAHQHLLNLIDRFRVMALADTATVAAREGLQLNRLRMPRSITKTCSRMPNDRQRRWRPTFR